MPRRRGRALAGGSGAKFWQPAKQEPGFHSGDAVPRHSLHRLHASNEFLKKKKKEKCT